MKINMNLQVLVRKIFKKYKMLKNIVEERIKIIQIILKNKIKRIKIKDLLLITIYLKLKILIAKETQKFQKMKVILKKVKNIV